MGRFSNPMCVLRAHLGLGLVPAIAALSAAVLLSACGTSRPLTVPNMIRTADVSRAAANAVIVSPFPGTVDASDTTQISFLAGPGTKVSDVRVVGSSSGTHEGRLEAYSTGTGESFLPSEPFVAGEHVTVRARVNQGAGATAVRTSFTIAIQAPVSQAEFPNHPGDPADVQHYLSAPALTPSSVRVTTAAQPGATPGDFFLAPYQGTGRPGPMIVDQTGNLVWFKPLPAGQSATNFRPQTYAGQTVLTW